MNLLVLTAAYPSPSDPGRAVAIESLSRALHDPPGAVARVVAPRVAPADPLEEERHGVPVRRFRYPGGGRRLKELARPSPLVVGAWLSSALSAALSETRRHAVQAILCHWVVPTGVVGALLSRRRRVPLVLVAHGSDLNRYARSSAIARRLARFALAASRRLVAVSGELGRIAVEELGADPERTSVIPMGVDSSAFHAPPGGLPGLLARRAAARAELGLDPSRALLLYVGDLIEEKGVRDLLAAHARMGASGPDLCLVGDGPLLQVPSADSASSGPRPRWAGRLPPAAVARWCHAADLLVLPSHGEGSPVSVQEALSCCVPVVASRVGGIPDLVEDAVTGRLVEPGDPGALEAAIRECLEPPRLEAMRRALLEAPRDRSAAACAARIRALLEEATA